MGSRDYIVPSAANRAMSKNTRPQHLIKDLEVTQTDLGRQSKSCTDDIGATIIVAANEPSQALFRIQEHVRKTVPRLVERRLIAENTTERVKGAIFDAEYAIDAVNSASNSLATFQSINDNLKNAVHLAQQIQHNQSQKPSMYHPMK